MSLDFFNKGQNFTSFVLGLQELYSALTDGSSVNVPEIILQKTSLNLKQ